MNELMDYQCIDWRKLLIIKGKSLKLKDHECYVLLLIMTMNDIQLKPINPQTISQLCSLSIKQIDKILLSLLDKHIISRKRGKLDLKPLYQQLLDQEQEDEQEVDLLSVFESVFARALNPLEIEIINSYKSSGYDDQMILDALNEAVKSGALNFRYIEKILDNWSKYGVKKRFAPTPQTTKIDVDPAIKDLKWWENQDE